MIYIDRNRVDEQGNSIRPDATWFQAATRATDIAKQEMGNHEADRDIYSDSQVRTALEKLFYEKCAYCESELKNTDWDVEHFRPKGRVFERSDHPGYYWLAYKWTNLYPACIFCNRRREDKPSWDNPTSGGTGGKATQFPLADEETRVMSHISGDISQEQTLLLNPCTEDPEEHLQFDPKGGIYATDNSQKGAATIEVCFLDRKRLRDLRKGIIDKVAELLKIIHNMEENGENVNDIVAQMKHHIQQKHLEDNCVYAAVARAVVNDPTAFGL